MNGTPNSPPVPRDTAAGSQGTQALVQTLRLGFFCLRAIIVLLLIIYVLSGQFIVGPNEEAFILRFGRLVGAPGEQVIESGRWHWAWPKPVDRIVRLPVKQSRTVSTDQFWYDEQENIMSDPSKSSMPPAGPLRVNKDGYLLTGDSNIVHTKWALSYLITNPIAYYFNYDDPEAVIRQTLENAVLKEVVRRKVDSVLYGRSDDLRIAVQETLTRLVAERRRVPSEDLGIDVRIVTYERRTPPRTTIAAFNQVVEAGQEKSQKINEAIKERNQRLQDARGTAARLVAEAESYRKRVVASVEADGDYFEKILGEYRKAPSTMLLTLYTNTLAKVLEDSHKYVVKGSGGDEVRLLIGPEPRNPNTPEDKGRKD